MFTKAKNILTMKALETGGGGGGLPATNPVVTDGLILWLHGADWDGSSAWVDRSTYANSFTKNGTVTTDGTWLTFDGSTGYFNGGNPAQYQITGALTMEARIKFTLNDTGARIIVGKWDTGTTNRGYGIAEYNAGLRFYTSKDGSNFKYQDSAGKNDGVEHHYVATFNPSVAWDTWVDGVKTNHVTTQIYTALFNATCNLWVGARPAGFYQGQLKTVRMYNRVLSDTEIATNYNSGN